MATPPTRVSYNVPSTGNYTSATSPKTTNTFDVVAGDVIVVLAQAEAASTIAAVTPTATGGSITWTARTQFPAATNANTSLTRCWTGVVGATATGITVSLVRPSAAADFWGFSATLVRDHGGVGQVFTGGITTGNGAPSVGVACSANSLVLCAVNDWNASDGTSRAWRSINGAAETETLYLLSASHHTVYGGYRADTGTAGTITQGLTAPTTMRWSLSGVEILGTTSGGAQTGTASHAGTGTISAAGVAGRIAAAALAATATITAAGVVDHPSSANIAGTGTVAAAGAVGKVTASSLSGTGSVAADGVVGKTTTSSLIGTGAVTAGGTTSGNGTGSASIAGTASATVSGRLAIAGTSSIAGTASSAAAGQVAKTGTAAIAGTGAVAAGGSTSSSGGSSGSIAGAGTLSAAGVVARSGTAAIAGSATVAGNGVRAVTSTATVTGTAAASTSGARGAYSAAAVVGTAAFAVTAAGLTGSATLQGLGTILALEFEIPDPVAPAERTHTVTAEDRTLVVPAESRRLTVAATSRTVIAEPEE